MKIIYYILLSSILFSCSDDVETQDPIDMKQLQEDLINANINAVNLESNQIDAYITTKQLEMITTATGLRYSIYSKNSEGDLIEEHQQAVIKYTVTLLDGTECYSTEEEVEEFTVGKDYVESGLHEGIRFMKAGDKAIIIMPSHLAHGLAGDLKKIPLRSTIVYDIELVAIK